MKPTRQIRRGRRRILRGILVGKLQLADAQNDTSFHHCRKQREIGLSSDSKLKVSFYLRCGGTQTKQGYGGSLEIHHLDQLVGYKTGWIDCEQQCVLAKNVFV
jgi:hypothetical protein